MIDHAANSLGLLITDRYGKCDCTAVDRDSMIEKTIMLLNNDSFTRELTDRLTGSQASSLCGVESVYEWDDVLIVVSDDHGECSEGEPLYDAHAACCAALVLKECGAVHTRLCKSIRHNGERIRIFGLDAAVPYTPEGERAEVKAIGDMCGIAGKDLESLRELLAVRINRYDMFRRKAAEAERVKNTLLAQDGFRLEWRELEYLNAGAYGYIFRAVSVFDGKDYALKVMSVGNDADKLWKAKRESTNASQFYHSDYIVKTFDDGKIIAGGEKYIWISMELLEPIPCEISDEETVAMIACDVCLALDEIHRNGGMAHRDVKPANILRGSGHWKLCDFGITKEVQGRDMATVIGTSDYMAPELLRAVAANTDRASYDNSVDVYALGITMYTLLNKGAAPFMAVPPYISRALDQKNASVRRIRGEQLPRAINCSEKLMKIIRKACSPDPADRYSSASKMYDALENFLDELF